MPIGAKDYVIPDGQTLASWSDGNTVKLWQVVDGALLHTLKVDDVVHMVFSPDGQIVAFATQSSGAINDETLERMFENYAKIHLFRVKDGIMLHSLDVSNVHIHWLTFSADSQRLFVCSQTPFIESDVNNYVYDEPEATLHAYLVRDGTILPALNRHTRKINHVAFTPDGSILALDSAKSKSSWWVVYRGEQPQSRLWRVGDEQPLHVFGGGESESFKALSPDTQILATADGTVKLWRAEDGALLHTLDLDLDIWYTAGIFSPDGKTRAYRMPNGTVELRRVSDGTVLQVLGEPIERRRRDTSRRVSKITFSRDGQTLASGEYDTIKLWRVTDGTLLHTLKEESSFGLELSPDGQTLASGKYNTIKLWRVSDGKLLHTLAGHNDRVLSIAFSPNGQILASGSADNTIKLWRVSDGTLLHTLEGHNGAVNSLAFSPDGQSLLSGSKDGTVRLWAVGGL